MDFVFTNVNDLTRTTFTCTTHINSQRSGRQLGRFMRLRFVTVSAGRSQTLEGLIAGGKMA